MAGRHSIQIEGLSETLRAMKLIDPTMRKEAQKRIRKVPAEVAKKTKERVPARPMRNWGSWSRKRGMYGDRAAGVTSMADVGALRWDQKAVKSGMRTLTGGQKLNVRLINKSAPGAAFERAGQRGNYSTPQGKVFADNLKWYGAAPRLLVKTWRDEKGITRTASEMGKVARFVEEEVKRRIA